MDGDQIEALREASGLRLDREGRWLHQGDLIEHERTVQALHRGLHRSEGGRWATRLGREVGYVQVDDAAFFALSVQVQGEALRALLLDGRALSIDPRTLALGEADALYCRLPDGERCKLSRAAQLSLAGLLREAGGRFFLEVRGRLVPIGADGGPEPVRRR